MSLRLVPSALMSGSLDTCTWVGHIWFPLMEVCGGGPRGEKLNVFIFDQGSAQTSLHVRWRLLLRRWR